MNRNDWQERNEGSRSFGRDYGEDGPHYPAGGAARGNDERRYRDATAAPRGLSGAQGTGARERGDDERTVGWRRDQEPERGASGFLRGMARGDSALFGAGEADYASGRGGESRWGERGHADEDERALRDYGRHARGDEYRRPGWQGTRCTTRPIAAGPRPTLDAACTTMVSLAANGNRNDGRRAATTTAAARTGAVDHATTRARTSASPRTSTSASPTTTCSTPATSACRSPTAWPP